MPTTEHADTAALLALCISEGVTFRYTIVFAAFVPNWHERGRCYHVSQARRERIYQPARFSGEHRKEFVPCSSQFETSGTYAHEVLRRLCCRTVRQLSQDYSLCPYLCLCFFNRSVRPKFGRTEEKARPSSVPIWDRRKLNMLIQSQSYFVITSFMIYSR